MDRNEYDATTIANARIVANATRAFFDHFDIDDIEVSDVVHVVLIDDDARRAFNAFRFAIDDEDDVIAYFDRVIDVASSNRE